MTRARRARFADEAQRIAPTEPLTLLLSAQASQLAGDRASAERTFQTMASARTRGCSACTACSSRRSGATTCERRGFTPKKRPRRAGAGLGRSGRVRCALRRRRLGRRARALDRNMKAGLVDTRRLSASARGAADGPRAGGRCARPRRAHARLRSKRCGWRRPSFRRRRLAGRLLGEAGDLRTRRAHRRSGLEGQSASRARRHLRPSSAGRFRARAARARRDAGPDDARSYRRRARGGARRGRRAGVRAPRARRWRRC